MVREGCDATILIFNNGGYQILRGEMHNVGINAPGPRALDLIEVERPAIEWGALAKSMGMPARQAATTDALAEALDTLSEEDREQLLPLFRAHLPKTLADLSFAHVRERVPDQYIKNAISSTLASKMVYKEGTKFIEAQPKHKLAEIALRYIQKEKEIAALIETLNSSSDMPEDQKKRILSLLDAGGARPALQFP